jgi:hypothetical protein
MQIDAYSSFSGVLAYWKLEKFLNVVMEVTSGPEP